MGLHTHMARAAECAARHLHGKGDFLSAVLAQAIPGTQALGGNEAVVFLEFPADLVQETFTATGEKTSRVYFDRTQVLQLGEAELARYIEVQTRQAFQTGHLHRA